MKSTPIRARDLGIPFSGAPGSCNAITDVPNLEVGYVTLWSGNGPLRVGEGPVRTGVTAILPRGRSDVRPCFGGWFCLNGAGEMTGLTWLEERGLCEGPILITNTHSVGIVRDSAIRWMRREKWQFDWTVPIVGETYDGHFNDIDGQHIKASHVFDALDMARGGPLAEGNVGGGAGMMTYEYKGGTGTSSRRLADDDGAYTVGVLVQSNYGARQQLRIGGIPIGASLGDDMPRCLDPTPSSDFRRPQAPWHGRGDGSIIVIVATNAPLLPHQLKRIAKRPALAIARLGGVGAAASGDIFLAISTANADVGERPRERLEPYELKMHPNLALTALFEATIDATEEAILNALVVAEPAEGANRLHVPRLPHARIQEFLHAHGLLRPGSRKVYR
jgi:D-aminopeptidase